MASRWQRMKSWWQSAPARLNGSHVPEGERVAILPPSELYWPRSAELELRRQAARMRLVESGQNIDKPKARLFMDDPPAAPKPIPDDGYYPVG